MSSYKLKITPEAHLEIQEAIDYYNICSKGLGKKFYLDLQDQFTRIKKNPFARAVRYDDVRFALLDRFPYAPTSPSTNPPAPSAFRPSSPNTRIPRPIGKKESSPSELLTACANKKGLPKKPSTIYATLFFKNHFCITLSSELHKTNLQAKTYPEIPPPYTKEKTLGFCRLVYSNLLRYCL